ncbi:MULTISPECIES: DUF4192 domain-containing protein [Mycobacterium]|uniref:DUF4192 domain-containing protein n=1 Tax=Mycobacterium TaxID=1763 RepID=UPI0019822BF6|nr:MULTISPECIES: DUF4192 domain-containing protein [Mycobacterium]MDP7706912.1 DUF4192 domain-containing protein [Mycobacterium sp. TY815]
MSYNDLRTPADLLAACPALLKYVPTNSMVVYLVQRAPNGGIRVRDVVCFDITITTSQAANFPTICALRSDRYDAAILLAICEQRHDIHARHILDTVREALQRNGVGVLRRIYARDVTTPGHWLDADTGDHGDTYPYTDSLHSARLVHSGTPIHRTRNDIAAAFEHLPPAPPVAVADHANLVLDTFDDITDILLGGPHTDPTLATRAGIVITGHPALRDAMIGLAIDQPLAAADLWTHIGRRLRGQPRAEALTIAAASLCLQGNTVHATLALQAAFAEAQATHTPDPDLAVALDSKLTEGLGPTEIRAAITAAFARRGDGPPQP